MLNIRDFTNTDKEQFCAMAESFYNSDAVCCAIPKSNILKTFDLCIKKCPYARGFIFEYNKVAAGFALISFTHSTEAGGLVVLIEEVFIKEDFRGKGIVKEFFKLLDTQYGSLAKRYKLEVTKSNKKAIEIYKHYGFEVVEYLAMVKDAPAPHKAVSDK